MKPLSQIMHQDKCGLRCPDDPLINCGREHNHAGPHATFDEYGGVNYAWPNEQPATRRERIATALTQGLLASGRYEHIADAVSVALGGADLLIEGLNK